MKYKIAQQTLKNGIRTYCRTSNQTEFVGFVIGFQAGSFKSKSNSALAHFFEHCLRNSSQKTSSTEFSTREVDIAASSNAYTSDTMMGITGFCFAKDLYLMLDDAFERICYPKFDPKETEDERKIVAQEINMYVKDVVEQNALVVRSLLFPKYGKVENNIIGSEEDLKKIKICDLKRYHQKWFAPNNMFVAVQGNVDANKLKKYLFKKFPNNGQPKIEEKLIENQPKGQIAYAYSIANKDKYTLRFGIGDWDSCSRSGVNFRSLVVALSNLSFCSILKKRIREEKNLVYAISARMQSSRGKAYFAVEFCTTMFNQVVDEVLNILAEIATDGVSDRILKQVKATFNKYEIREQEDNFGAMLDSVLVMMSRGEDVSENRNKLLRKLINETTVEGLQEAAKQILNAKRLIVTSDTKEKDEEKLHYFFRAFDKTKRRLKNEQNKQKMQ